MADDELVENEDFYREGGTIVFTARYHLRRGYCCNSGCRHCPFDTANTCKRKDESTKHDATTKV